MGDKLFLISYKVNHPPEVYVVEEHGFGAGKNEEEAKRAFEKNKVENLSSKYGNCYFFKITSCNEVAVQGYQINLEKLIGH